MNCGHTSVPLAALSCLWILGIHREEECPSTQQFYRPLPPFTFTLPNQVSVFTCHEWTMELGDRGRWWYTRWMVACLHCSDSNWSWLVLCRLLIPPYLPPPPPILSAGTKKSYSLWRHGQPGCLSLSCLLDREIQMQMLLAVWYSGGSQ